MAKFKLTYNPTTTTANVLAVGAATPSGSNDLGVIDHDPSHVTDREDPAKHVLYQTVQNQLYLIGVRDPVDLTITMGV